MKLRSLSPFIFAHAAMALSLGVLMALPQSVRADASADALFARCLAAEKSAQTLQGDFTVQAGNDTGKGTLQLQKPNIAHVVMTPPKSGGVILHSNGKTFTLYHTTENAYQTQPADMSGGNVVAMVPSFEAAVFFNPDLLNRQKSQGSGFKIAENVTIGGISCKTLQLIGTGQNTVKFYIGPDYLLRGYTEIDVKNGAKQTLETRLVNVKVSAPLPASALGWTLPKGALTAQQYAQQHSQPSSGTSQDEGLLPVGKAAPVFELQQLGGGKINLANAVKANKVTLVNFWASWCGPCREELPHLNKLLTEMRNKGFDILSINVTDNADTVGKVWKSGGFSMKVLLKGDDVANKYKVSGIPTNYLVGSDGKILAAYVGFDEAGIRQTLAKAGVK